MEQSEAGCGDAPDPVLLAFVLDASLVAAKLRLLRNCGFKLKRLNVAGQRQSNALSVSSP
jgi:hypothetical protein